jgi:hypothetical protein
MSASLHRQLWLKPKLDVPSLGFTFESDLLFSFRVTVAFQPLGDLPLASPRRRHRTRLHEAAGTLKARRRPELIITTKLCAHRKVVQARGKKLMCSGHSTAYVQRSFHRLCATVILRLMCFFIVMHVSMPSHFDARIYIPCFSIREYGFMKRPHLCTAYVQRSFHRLCATVILRLICCLS